MPAIRWTAVWAICFSWLSWAASSAVAAADETPEKPEREIVAAFEYPRLTTKTSESLSLDLIVKNNGRKDETVLLEVTKSPASLDCEIEQYSDVIGGVFVASGEKKTLKLSARLKEAKKGKEGEQAEEAAAAPSEKAKKIPPGSYEFAVKASTEDGSLTQTAKTEVTVRSEREEGEAPEAPVTLTCSYPNLRGSNDSDFKFSVDIHNNTDEEDMASLRAEAPRGWEVAFKPSYEDKYIGSLKVEANLSKSVDVEVTPPPGAKVGTYPITMFAKLSKSEEEASRDLTVELTGTYRIQCRTLDDVLSLTARGGEKSNVSIYVMNRGTAEQHNVTFDSFKPENWKVEFKPERIDTIEPGGMKQVEVTITPAAEALVGDYSVGVNIKGEKAEDDLELRVTVRAAATWAWIGVGIIVAVIAILSVMFKVLGRR